MRNKTAEIEINVSKLYDLFNEIAMDIKNRKVTRIPGVKLDGSNGGGNTDIQSILPESAINGMTNDNVNIDFSSFITEQKDLKLKFESFLKEFYESKPKSKSITHDSKGRTENLLSNQEEEVINTNFKRIKKEEINMDVIVENLNSINDNLKILSYHFTTKANKDDLEKLIKHIFTDIEKIQIKSNESISKLEAKQKNSPNESTPIDKHEIVQYILIIDQSSRKISERVFI